VSNVELFMLCDEFLLGFGFKSVIVI